LNSLHQHEPARSSLLRALELEPDSAEAHSNLGVVLTSLKEHQGALAHVDRALALQPDSPQALHNRGQVLALLHRYEEAAQAYARLLAVAPEHEHAASNLLWARLCACNWTDYGDQLARLHDAVAAGKSVIEPWAFLALSDNAAMQLTCARTYAARFPAPASKLCDGGQRSHDKIRVAYLSADFHDHATSYLMAELFEKHDTRRFSFTAISFGPASGGAMRERLARSFGAFIDVRDKSDLEAARLIRDLEIDIAVDLKGYTTDARPGILAHRPAPIQVNYLGYPGTLGADCIDYLIADRRLIPPDHHLCYSEKIVYMPDSSQVNDSQRRIGGQPISRLDAGLPQQGFVFCCFNNNYKIGPPMFQVWMNLLRRVPGSVLWLLEDNPAAVRNLRSAAKRQGIAPERLVFAPRIPLEAHLARHALADLFLDTLPCNAHTTASDSLWAGLPVLTCLGSTFAGRVAASLLDTVGLPELVAADLDGYEAMALALATQADRLAQVRDRLAVAHGTSPLFDSGRFARHLESAYASMWERQQLGLPPTSFAVVPASI
jgi:protein O-GlcNAc transferase